MSLFSRIAREGAAPARGFSLKWTGMVAAGLALGVAGGFVIVNSRPAAEPFPPVSATATGLAHDDFVRLNTTELETVAPASAGLTESAPAVDPFIQINTTALENLVATGSLEHPTARVSEQRSGPR